MSRIGSSWGLPVQYQGSQPHFGLVSRSLRKKMSEGLADEVDAILKPRQAVALQYAMTRTSEIFGTEPSGNWWARRLGKHWQPDQNGERELNYMVSSMFENWEPARTAIDDTAYETSQMPSILEQSANGLLAFLETMIPEPSLRRERIALLAKHLAIIPQQVPNAFAFPIWKAAGWKTTPS